MSYIIEFMRIYYSSYFIAKRSRSSSKIWDESTYDPSNHEDDEDEEMEDEF
jgi:hypothetical protein